MAPFRYYLCAVLAVTAVATPGCEAAADTAVRTDGAVRTLQARTTDQVAAHLQSARGPVRIVLTAPRYGVLDLRGMTLPRGSTIESDAGKPAILAGLVLRDMSNLTVRNVTVAAARGKPATARYAALIQGGKGITLDGIRLFGPTGAFDRSFVAALMIRSSSDVTVRRGYFTRFPHGIALLDVTRTSIHSNEFESLQTDAIRGGGVDQLSIANNVMTNFQPAPKDHPDGIQLWSTNQEKPGRNISITGNLIVRGRGSPTQGVFIRDTHRKLPFQDVRVENNLVIGGLYNGISVSGVDRLSLRGNTVVPTSDRKSWIRLEYTRNAVAVNNASPFYVVKKNRSEPVQRGNRVTRAHDGNPAPLISQWVKQTPGFETPGPVLRRLLSTGR